MKMRCCVPFCENTSTNVYTAETKGISFHGLPSDVRLRAAWLRALGKQDSHLSDSAVVCSQHFLNNEIYESESGLRQICIGAVPSTVQVCMICLDTDSKLFLMSKYKLEAYERLTGYPLYDQGNLKQTLCVQCAQRLINFSRFRDKSLRARALMMDLVEKHEFITRRHVKMINRTKNQIKSNFVVTTLGPDYCDLYILDSSEPIGYNAVVKNEKSDDSMLIDEDIQVANEDENNADYISDELVVSKEEFLSDSEIILETVQETEMPDPLKYEIAPFQCSLCFAEFVGEHAHMQHMHMHDQNGGEDIVCGTSQVCKPHTAGSSSHSSRLTENKQAIQLNQALSPSAHSPQTAVAPFSARLATNNENKMQAEDADTVQNSKQLLKINKDEHNHIFDINKITNIDKLTNCVVILCDTVKKPEKGVSLAKIQPSISSCHMGTASKDVNCKIVSRNEDARHTIEDTGPVTNKVKVTKRDVTETSQSKTYCLDNYNSEDSLFIHKKWYTCDVCENTFKWKSLLVKHIKTHSDIKPFTCKFCHFKTKYKESLKTHIMRTHTGDRPFTCKLCEFKCAVNSNLVTHMRTHTGEKPFSCKICKCLFARSDLLVKHLRTHTGEKPYSCKLCEYKCTENSNLVRHMRTHTGEKRYCCTLCKYKCTASSNLVTHMRTHTGEKPFSCKMCECLFARRAHLVRHMRTHTGEKPYCCTLCKYKCADNRNLVEHMRIHTGEKPFTCKLCEYKFVRNRDLMRHMRTHTGEKPFTCKLCEFKSAHNSSLLTHMRIHSGEKPFSCEIRDYKCVRNNALVRHMRTHTDTNRPSSS
ncbi:uncharacterized protein [Maniola hyperantus]|uniref:uncharacterized protein n=1 Tax=Aphantopus hyperantus TaxID=2795564 RepID=UPI0037491CFA